MQSGDEGPRVRDLHQRLAALGFDVATSTPDVFDPVTTSLVEAFQRSRGLPLSGIADDVTWQRLVEAGWRLGDRLLYLATPYLRGDDVADLQVRLSKLGFDPGRIDGLFGPLLHHALSEFQRNCALAVDGTLTRRTLLELQRVTPSTSDRVLVTDVRQKATVTRPDGPLLWHGASPLLPELNAAIAGSTYDQVRSTGSVEQFALWANEQRARGVVSVERGDSDGIALHYWSGYRSYSREGERLASRIASELANTPISQRLTVAGMALPVLRETQMTSLHIQHGEISDDERRHVIRAITAVISDFFHSYE